MTKRNVPLIALIISLLMLSSIVGIGCLVSKSESDSLIATARQTLNGRMKWLDEQKFQGPDTPAPLNITIDSVESNTRRMGRDDGGVNVDMGIIGGGVGVGAGGGGG